MNASDTVWVVLCNAPDAECAHRLCDALLERRQAACINLLPAIVSHYRWQEQRETATEIPMLIKTTAAGYPAVEATLRELHPYDVPEIIALPVAAGLPAYLAWVAAEVKA